MSLVRSSSAKLFKLVSHKQQLMVVRSCGWIRDYKPGPYPHTAEEREAAAKKYNLIPEDYEPYEEGSGYGDYPKMPILSQDAADPYEDFDYYYRRKDFGTTYHIDYDAMTYERSNFNQRYRYSAGVMFSGLLAPILIASFCLWLDRHFDLHTFNPMKPKQYYNDGKIHYTFEPLDE